MNATGCRAFKLSPYRIDINANPWGKVLKATGDWLEKLYDVAGRATSSAFDAHAKIFEPWQAVQLGNLLAPFNPLFYEEPIRPENYRRLGPDARRAEGAAGDGREPVFQRSNSCACCRWRAPTSSSRTSASSAG